jgi:hypothetical protein
MSGCQGHIYTNPWQASQSSSEDPSYSSCHEWCTAMRLACMPQVNRTQNALRSLPTGRVRAVLWYQVP